MPRMTEKQAACIAAELVRRIESRRAVKAAAASALEKTAARFNPKWFKDAYRWMRGAERGVPRAATTVKGTTLGRMRASAAEALDRRGMSGLADRIAAKATGPGTSAGIPISDAHKGYELLGREARTHFGLKGRQIVENAEKARPGFLKGFWDDFSGSGLRSYEKKWHINPEDQAKAWRMGRDSLNDLDASYRNWARTRYGYMHSPQRTMARDIGIRGGAMDRAIMSVPTTPQEFMANAQKRKAYGDAVLREYYRKYQRMLKARAAAGKAALGAAGVGGIAYANMTADDYARAAQEAQAIDPNDGSVFNVSSDERNRGYDEMNDLLRWMVEQQNMPQAGTAEADMARGYNIR